MDKHKADGKNPLKIILNNIIYPACAYFTIGMFITSAVSTIASQSNLAATLGFMGMLFLFCLVISLLNRLFKTKLPMAAKVGLHFLGTTAAFVVVFILFSEYYKKGSSAVFITVLFMLIYALILAVVMLIYSLRSKSENSNQEYDSQFGAR